MAVLGDAASNAQLGIAYGGTNATSITAQDKFLIYNGTSINSSAYDNSSFSASGHTHTDLTGTTSATWVIDSDASTPIKLKNAGSGLLEVKNNADSGYLDLKVGNLTVAGTTTTINSETLTIDDNIIVLNNNYTGGTPSENGGVEVERGTLTNASLIWNESSDVWQCGLSGGEETIRVGTVAVTVGGTGLTSCAQGDLLYGSAENTLSALAKSTDATRYLANTGSSNNPAWAQVNLANGVTGTLDETNGGTGNATWSQGDLLYASAGNTLSALTKNATATRYLSNTGGDNNPAWAQVNLSNGITGTLPIGNGGTGQTAKTAAFDALAPTTTKGDLIVSNGSDNIRLAIGTNDYILTADSGEASGVKWAEAPAGSNPGGSGTEIQYRGGETTFSGDTDFTYTAASNTVTINNGVIYSGSTAANDLTIKLSDADASSVFQVTDSGDTTVFSVDSDGKVGFYGASPGAQSTGWAYTNYTSDKVIDCNNTSIHELADSLATLVAALIGVGLLSGTVES